jgi:hypothetical protein
MPPDAVTALNCGQEARDERPARGGAPTATAARTESRNALALEPETFGSECDRRQTLAEVLRRVAQSPPRFSRLPKNALSA